MTKWLVQSRRNSDLTVVDSAVDDFENLTAIRRFNDMGTWTMQLRLESKRAALFLPDSNLGLPNGILIWKDNEDGLGPQLFLSGPQRGVQWGRKADNTGYLLATGMCDNYWLSKRLALTTVDYRYATQFTNKARYYKLTETSGTVATDSGTQLQNGTYSNGPSLGVLGLIDDPTTAVIFNGTNQDITIPTASLSTGNSAWTVGGWGMVAAYPSVAGTMWSFGTNAASQAMQIGIDSGGHPFFKVRTLATQTGTTPVSLNTPFMIVVTWDGTTMTGYLNGVVFATQTPGALNIAYGGAVIGADITAVNFWGGQLAQAFFDTLGNYSAATVQNWWLTGQSRQAFNEYATESGTVTSNTISRYVDRNCGGAAQPAIRIIPGLSLPVTTYSQIGGFQQATWEARFDNLLLLIKTIALASTPEVGFQLIQRGTNLAFEEYLPVDRTATAIFSLDRGNLLEYDVSYQAADANYLLAGGRNGNSTSLTSRMFGQGRDLVSISRFGYLEDFLDYRRTQDPVSMATVINARLSELAEKRNINATMADTPGLYYLGPGNRGYQLGDKVAVILENGLTFTDLIREVKVVLEPGKPAILTPAIGTPLTAEIIGEYDSLARRLRGDDATITELQVNY